MTLILASILSVAGLAAILPGVNQDIRNAFQSGMDSYVEKPMNISKLLRAIQTALKRSH